MKVRLTLEFDSIDSEPRIVLEDLELAIGALDDAAVRESELRDAAVDAGDEEAAERHTGNHIELTLASENLDELRLSLLEAFDAEAAQVPAPAEEPVHEQCAVCGLYRRRWHAAMDDGDVCDCADKQANVKPIEGPATPTDDTEGKDETP